MTEDKTGLLEEDQVIAKIEEILGIEIPEKSKLRKGNSQSEKKSQIKNKVGPLVLSIVPIEERVIF